MAHTKYHCNARVVLADGRERNLKTQESVCTRRDVTCEAGVLIR